jgi:caffeoyl-CoA O-methyltransferase
MAASPDEVQLFGLLLEMLGARNAIEVGVFTGYSLLATALALPDDGKVMHRQFAARKPQPTARACDACR